MTCPRCGHRNDEGVNFCSRCGERLGEASPRPKKSEARSPGRSFGQRLIGSSRRERLITAATIVALAVAVAAFIALTGDEPSDDDSYVVEADRICADAKQAGLAASSRLVKNQTGHLALIARYARELGRIVNDTRPRLAALDPPPDRSEAAAELDTALGELAPATRGFAQAAASDSATLPDEVARLGVAGDRVEAAIVALGLEDCAQIPIVAPNTG